MHLLNTQTCISDVIFMSLYDYYAVDIEPHSRNLAGGLTKIDILQIRFISKLYLL